MPTFIYVLKDHRGVKKEGSIQSDTLNAALNKLSEGGNTVISVTSSADKSGKKQDSLLDRLSLAIYKLRTRVPMRTLVFFTRQLATMFAAGLTLEKALGNLANDEPNKRFKKALRKITSDVKKGQSLSEALSEHPGVFDSLYIALVKAGEISGTLTNSLDELSNYLETVEDTRRKVVSGLTYPAFISVFLTGVIAVLLIWVIPSFRDVYAKFNAELPLPTQMLLEFSAFVQKNLFHTGVFIIFGLLGIFVFGLTDRGRYFIDSIKIRLPVLGVLLEYSIMSKFAKTFGILMGSGVPIMEALSLSQNVVRNRLIEIAIRDARGMVREGYSIANALRKTEQFPPTLLQLTATGEETGELDTLLYKVAEFYEKQLDSVVKRITSLIEPVIIVSLGAVVLIVVVALYLPVFEMGKAMKRGVR
ncbi:MAG: pilus assembly protein PilC [Candidatus Cloacimonetes bacterium 4572_55]|nr:MAG: pilus assembly protein PilC [Candidatus Cloacimonetes bacterium 4572_55]